MSSAAPTAPDGAVDPMEVTIEIASKQKPTVPTTDPAPSAPALNVAVTVPESLPSLSQPEEPSQAKALRKRNSFHAPTSVCVVPIKTFLYAWKVLLILVGISIVAMAMFFLYYEVDTWVVPALAYAFAGYTGIGMVVVSSIGLYGLAQQRHCVTDKRRNYALGFYIIWSFVGTIVLIFAAVMALIMMDVSRQAYNKDFGESAVVLMESACLEKIESMLETEPQRWRDIQEDLHCCGYDDTMLSNSSRYDDDILGYIQHANNVTGSYCSTSREVCVATHNDVVPCPKADVPWCREALIDNAKVNFLSTGILALSFGACQLVSTLLSTYILLFDVRVREPPPIDYAKIRAKQREAKKLEEADKKRVYKAK